MRTYRYDRSNVLDTINPLKAQEIKQDLAGAQVAVCVSHYRHEVVDLLLGAPAQEIAPLQQLGDALRLRSAVATLTLSPGFSQDGDQIGVLPNPARPWYRSFDRKRR